jgi:hypothetical protein
MRESHTTGLGKSLLLLAAALGLAGIIMNGDKVLVVGWIVLGGLLNRDVDPPPLVQGHITAENWREWQDERRIRTILQERFPPGTHEDALKSVLIEQGFKQPKPHCARPEPTSPPITVGPCADPSKVLAFEWGRGRPICNNRLLVWWKTDGGSAIAEVRGSYKNVCL